MKLLTIGNAKTVQGEELGYLTGILHLNPETSPKLCPNATPECKALCLNRSGRAEVFSTVLDARTRKSNLWLTDKEAFIKLLKKDFHSLIKRGKKLGLKVAVRLNGTSDVPWEYWIDFAEFPEIDFYDYTKIQSRMVSFLLGNMAKNYHLTFSRSELNDEACNAILSLGGNVAVPFKATIPATWKGYKTIDGTRHDLTFLHAKSTVLGLLPKGSRARKQASISPFFV